MCAAHHLHLASVAASVTGMASRDRSSTIVGRACGATRAQDAIGVGVLPSPSTP